MKVHKVWNLVWNSGISVNNEGKKPLIHTLPNFVSWYAYQVLFVASARPKSDTNIFFLSIASSHWLWSILMKMIVKCSIFQQNQLIKSWAKVCSIKFCSKQSTVILLCLLRNLMEQSLSTKNLASYNTAPMLISSWSSLRDSCYYIIIREQS